ncbi:MAG: hypothetical protein FJX47_19030, partial [Alphaproteobacteria bacterium]|nr:hypothetical protein [Alphaproteobacteria bacterium]
MKFGRRVRNWTARIAALTLLLQAVAPAILAAPALAALEAEIGRAICAVGSHDQGAPTTPDRHDCPVCVQIMSGGGAPGASISVAMAFTAEREIFVPPA